MIVLDASVLIAHLDRADVHHARATTLLLDLADEPLGTSPMTLAEVLVDPTRAGRIDEVHAALDPLLTVVPWTADAPRRLARLRVDTGVGMPDCCVLLAAEQEDAGIATFDARLAKVARARGIVVHD